MTQSTNSARAAALARRKAMSTSGKAAIVKGATASASSQQTATRSATTVVSPAMYKAAANGSSNAKSASKARREAMSSRGKAGVPSTDRTRQETVRKVANNNSNQNAAPKQGCGCGCGGEKASCQTEMKAQASAPKSSASSAVATMGNMKNQRIKMSSARAASLARRKAMSKSGKAAINNKGITAAQTARAVNPSLTSRELAKALREQQSRQGKTQATKTTPCGPRRKAKSNVGAAEDQPWKVGASETVSGQTVTGTMVGRSEPVTGDEPSTCRDVTGTEYLGADVFRDFCQAEPASPIKKVTVTTTSHGNSVSGNRIGRGDNVTGNEPGSNKSVTGDEYLSSEEMKKFGDNKTLKSPRKISVLKTNQDNTMTGTNVGRSEKVTGDEVGSSNALTGTQYLKPTKLGNEDLVARKVGKSETLRGGSITGTMVDRKEQVTGNEAGSCRNVTGDDYTGSEQFNTFCKSAPQPMDQKVGVSSTHKGNSVTGVMTDRTETVTGNEPGTCSAITGTPYASSDQSIAFCDSKDQAMVEARNSGKKRSTPGSVLTGNQPGTGGVLTGDRKGQCEAVSGTPYVGADQFSQVCSTASVQRNEAPDFPQPLAVAMNQSNRVVPQAINQSEMATEMQQSVTGSRYEKGSITGPFGMASGKVTGTEQARFGQGKPVANPIEETVVADLEGRARSRISGEGMNIAAKITGDDWERGDHVTGTEGPSAVRRNPTIQSPLNQGVRSASAMHMAKRNEEVTMPVSRVTGSSGNTEQGSLITYSGGARG